MSPRDVTSGLPACLSVDRDGYRFAVYLSQDADEPLANDTPLFVAHHGAGSSAMSFAMLSQELKQLLPQAVVLCFDARGHGNTTCTEPALCEHDLSISTLATDTGLIFRSVQTQLHWPAPLGIILVGHSLGAAVLTYVAYNKLLQDVRGLIAIDVVEGSAIDVLVHMNKYLSTRPECFASMQNAIDWHLESKTLHNKSSALLSVPHLLYRDADTGKLCWKTNLPKTRKYWDTWFKGLSNNFLAIPVGKLLVLADTNRLDKPLMIGQMQGKFQLQIVAGSGHFVHEDAPVEVAQFAVELWQRSQPIDLHRIRSKHLIMSDI